MNEENTCSEPDCPNPIHSRGLCDLHRKRAERARVPVGQAPVPVQKSGYTAPLGHENFSPSEHRRLGCWTYQQYQEYTRHGYTDDLPEACKVGHVARRPA